LAGFQVITYGRFWVITEENSELKEVVAEITLKNRVLKKSLTGLGEEDDT
jgi:hypothetical protein